MKHPVREIFKLYFPLGCSSELIGSDIAAKQVKYRAILIHYKTDFSLPDRSIWPTLVMKTDKGSPFLGISGDGSDGDWTGGGEWLC